MNKIDKNNNSAVADVPHYTNKFYDDTKVNSKIIDISKEESTHPSYYLRLRDLEGLVSQFKPADKRVDELEALDYGCGAGRPTRHLKKIGMIKIIGCDINESLLRIAREFDPQGEYVKIKASENPEDMEEKLLPFGNNRFDFALSCMVIFEVDNQRALQKMFNETSRVLRPGGLYFLIKCPKDLYSLEANRKWRFFNSNFPENVNLTSGSPFKFDYFGMMYNSFYWEDHDVIEYCARARLEHVHTHHVLGKDDVDGVEWLDEKLVAPYMVMIFKKV